MYSTCSVVREGIMSGAGRRSMPTVQDRLCARDGQFGVKLENNMEKLDVSAVDMFCSPT